MSYFFRKEGESKATSQSQIKVIIQANQEDQVSSDIRLNAALNLQSHFSLLISTQSLVLAHSKTIIKPFHSIESPSINFTPFHQPSSPNPRPHD